MTDHADHGDITGPAPTPAPLPVLEDSASGWGV